jgi:hypothetical protein
MTADEALAYAGPVRSLAYDYSIERAFDAGGSRVEPGTLFDNEDRDAMAALAAEVKQLREQNKTLTREAVRIFDAANAAALEKWRRFDDSCIAKLQAKIERVEALSKRWSEDAGYYTGHSESLDKALLGEPWGSSDGE